MNRIDEKVAEISEQLASELGEIELKTMEFSLSDAIREGSRVTTQAVGWGNGETACALTASYASAKARGYV